MKALFYRTTFFLLLPFLFSGFRARLIPDYPEPEGIKNLLFYTQRSTNKNTIIYEVNFDANNEVDVKQPIKTYWINYATDGSSEDLNLIERKRAYGVECEMTDAVKRSFKINFVSYKKRSLYLMRSPFDNKYHVFCHVNGNLVVLKRVFIQTEGGLLGTPKLKYVEITGIDPATKEETEEKIDV